MNILVLDMTHGGDILAGRYISEGHNVTCVDVYHTIKKDSIVDETVRCKEIYQEVPSGHYDMVVMPCHCPDRFLDGCIYSRRIFFSEAVRDLIDDKRFRIEITGVKGKTSTCYLLAHILGIAGKKVFLHSSRGQGPWVGGEHIIEARRSIAPPSLLALPKGDYDVMICEVSLGGSGMADIAGITNLVENYGIADNTRKAEGAKADIMTVRGTNIVSSSEIWRWSKYCKGTLHGCGARVMIVGEPHFGESLDVEVDYNGRHRIKLDGSYLSLQYLDAMSMALEICFVMCVETEKVLEGLRTFKGVPGRGEISTKGGIRYLKERNPGISHMSVERTLECLKRMNVLKDSVLIIDPVSRKVCDKMDRDSIKQVASRYGVDIIFSKGDGSLLRMPEGKTMVIEMVKEGYQ
jgi:coenzyme F430 synthetase